MSNLHAESRTATERETEREKKKKKNTYHIDFGDAVETSE